MVRVRDGELEGVDLDLDDVHSGPGGFAVLMIDALDRGLDTITIRPQMTAANREEKERTNNHYLSRST